MLKVKSAVKNSLFVPFMLASALITLIVLAFFVKNDEVKKTVNKIAELVPADIIPAPKA